MHNAESWASSERSRSSGRTWTSVAPVKERLTVGQCHGSVKTMTQRSPLPFGHQGLVLWKTTLPWMVSGVVSG